jgi:hypothetical protein
VRFANLRWWRRFSLGLLFLAGVVPVAAQDGATVLRAQAFKDGDGAARVIYVWFDRSFGGLDAVTAAETATNYAILDLAGREFTDASEATVAVAEYPGETAQESSRRKIDASVVQLRFPNGLQDPGEPRYALLVQRMTSGGTVLERQTIAVTFAAASSSPEAFTRWVAGTAVDREEADLYFAGDAGRTAGANFVGALDVKVRIPLFRPRWWRRLHAISPEFDLQVSSDPEANPDSLKAGAGWSWFPLQQKRGALSAIRWTNTGGLESNGEVTTTNLLLTSKVMFLPMALTRSRVVFYVNPFAALEGGTNISRPGGLSDVQPSGIVRSDIGAIVAISVAGGALDSVDWTTEYVHRRLHADEFDSAGSNVGTAHDWFDTRLELNVTRFFGIFMGLQHGRQPPVYTQVDRRFRVGLAFKSKFSRQ